MTTCNTQFKQYLMNILRFCDKKIVDNRDLMLYAHTFIYNNLGQGSTIEKIELLKIEILYVRCILKA